MSVFRSRRLAILLVDALAETYIRPDVMPYLSSLIQQGGKVPLTPSPFYCGGDPILFGKSGFEMGRFTGYRFDARHSPYRGLDSALSLLDRMPKGRYGKLARTLYARRVLSRANRNWMSPQIFPAQLLPKIAPAGADETDPAHVVHRAEKAGLKCRWYSRDFPYEGSKWLGSQLFSLRYSKAFEQWLLLSDSGGPPDLILAEISVDLDRCGHQYGPGLDGSVAKAARKLDKKLQYLSEQTSLWPGLHLLIIGDHGMSRVDRIVNIEAIFKDLGVWDELNGNAIVSSTLIQFRFANDSTASTLGRCQPEIEKRTFGKLVFFEEFERFGIPADRCWGDAILLIPEGALILPNHFQGNREVLGMHGYFESHQQSSMPAAVFSGDGWNRERFSQKMPMKELYRAIVDLLGV